MHKNCSVPEYGPYRLMCSSQIVGFAAYLVEGSRDLYPLNLLGRERGNASSIRRHVEMVHTDREKQYTVFT